MTRALTAAYLACLYFAASDGPHALIFTAAAMLTGFLALFALLTRLTSKGRDPHV
ncbi:hypothetical protein [Deinococcus frigens]|uniref:hypothetical protein n=1 Tax=Deinococcus frigens TaxID=249403 RepID=UPI000A67315E|nr:hypothetical protein [Deinococcus frigens]